MSIGVLSPADLIGLPETPLIADARSAEEYALGHLPGAIHLAWEEWCAPAPPHAGPALAQPGYWGLLAEEGAEWYAERLARLGLHNERPIVVYANGVRSKGREGRVAWMLLYLGAAMVYLLDGGWPGWLAQGGAVEMAMVVLPRGRFTASPQEQRRCRLRDLAAAHRAGTPPLLLDTRSSNEYLGQSYDYLPRMGHLPAARWFDFDALFDEAHRFIGPVEYLRRLPAELRGAPYLVTYCEVGVRASLVALLHEVYTGQVVSVFDGSHMEWSLDPTLPVHQSVASDLS